MKFQKETKFFPTKWYKPYFHFWREYLANSKEQLTALSFRWKNYRWTIHFDDVLVIIKNTKATISDKDYNVKFAGYSTSPKTGIFFKGGSNV